MKVLLGLLCLALVVAVAVAEGEVFRSPVFGYHRREGIPKATLIKAAEEAAVETGAERIVGGYPNDISNIPYTVGLIITVLWNLNSMCGATLISANRVLTAAHCKNDGDLTAQAFTAVFGSNTIFTGGTRLNVNPDDVIMHPSWNPFNVNSDIAVMRLPTALIFSDVIRPAALPSGSDLNNDHLGDVGRVSGWGLTSDDGTIGFDQRLHSVYLPIMPNFQCTEVYPWWHASNICVMGAGGRSGCSGDSGGPLTMYNVDQQHVMVFGVFSYGHIIGCEIGYPTVFTRVASFVTWIHSI